MSYLDKKVTNRKDLDPIDWAIAAVVVGGMSLVVSIKAVIDTKRIAKQKDVERKAISGNRVRLNKIRHQLDRIDFVLSDLQEVGARVNNPNETGILKSSIEFESEGQLETYNEMFDSLIYSVSRINRLFGELDADGLPFSEEDKREFVDYPIKWLNEESTSVLSPDIDSKERFERIRRLVGGYKKLISDIDGAIGKYE